jgi:hypothetical protein
MGSPRHSIARPMEERASMRGNTRDLHRLDFRGVVNCEAPPI